MYLSLSIYLSIYRSICLFYRGRAGRWLLQRSEGIGIQAAKRGEYIHIYMHIHVCIYVCMYACIYICLSIYRSLNRSIFWSSNLSIYRGLTLNPRYRKLFTSKYMYVHIDLSVYRPIERASERSVCLAWPHRSSIIAALCRVRGGLGWVYIHIYICTCIYVCMYECMYICLYQSVHPSIYLSN